MARDSGFSQGGDQIKRMWSAFDIVEISPRSGDVTSEFSMAKLVLQTDLCSLVRKI